MKTIDVGLHFRLNLCVVVVVTWVHLTLIETVVRSAHIHPLSHKCTLSLSLSLIHMHTLLNSTTHSLRTCVHRQHWRWTRHRISSHFLLTLRKVYIRNAHRLQLCALQQQWQRPALLVLRHLLQIYQIFYYLAMASFDSSVGRAEDCSWIKKQTSLGRWFDSGSKEFFWRPIF